MAKKAPKYTKADLINCVADYRLEAENAKRDRMAQNKLNFDAYHCRQNWDHKIEGQSREFIPKVSTATEQNSNMIQQGLMDIGDWFKVEAQAGIDEDTLQIKPSQIYKLLERQLSKDGLVKKTGDIVKLGILGSLMIIKVSGKYVNKPKFVADKIQKDDKIYNQLRKVDEKVWQLSLDLVRQEDFYPDPTGRNLYEIQDSYIDLWELQQMAESDEYDYDLKEVDQIQGGYDSSGSNQDQNKSRETGQNVAGAGYRKQVKLTEIWGNFIDSTGKLVYENCVATIVNDRHVIQMPTPNPYWHQESPFVCAALLSVPHSVWSKAMADAPVMLNFALNEIFNLNLDSGLMSVHGIKQIREDWLAEPSQVSDGISAGITLKANSSTPPGGKVLENLFTGGAPNEALQMIGLLQQEISASSFSNEMRQGGTDNQKQRATAIVESSNAINSMFTGMTKNLEGDEGSGLMTRVISKAWKVTAQNMKDLDSREVETLLGKSQAEALLSMGNEQIFAESVGSTKFRVFGISAIMNKMKDFTKLTALLQTVFSNPALTEAFMKKYSIPKYLTEVMRSLDIDTFKIEADENEGGDLTKQPPQGAGVAAGSVPNTQSQIPQAGAAGNQGDLNPMSQMQPAGANGL